MSPYRMQTQFSRSVTDQPEQNKTSESKMPYRHFSSDSTKQDDKLNRPEQTSPFKMPTMFSTEQDSTSTPKVVERSQQRAQAQQELQHMEALGAGQEDPYAQDALGIGMLLQAAKVIDDRERAQELQTGDLTQLDGSSDSDVHNAPSEQPDDNDSRFKDASELDWLSSTRRTPRADMLIASPSIRGRPATSNLHSPNEPHRHKRRRSERLTSASSPMDLNPQSPSPFPERASKRARSEQPTSTSRSRSKSTHMSTTTATAKPITAESSTAPDPSANSTTHQDMIIRERIKAIYDKATAMSKGTWKPNFPPLVREYIEEQRLRKEKTMLWLERQEQGQPDEVAGEEEEEEGEEDEDEEPEDEGDRDEEYDEGVEGGYWIESSGSESQESHAPGPRESGKGKETKHAQLKIQDSQSGSDHDHDLDAPINVGVNDNKNNTAKNNNSNTKSEGQHLSSDPIIPPGPARPQHAADEAKQEVAHDDTEANGNDDAASDCAGDTINVHSQSSLRGRGRGRGRRLVRGHRKSGSDEV
ncbi:hypothetical protein EPUS_07959 [Endocarpon pusillum Z07020]|uniref:Uncharacterized protein n=1 Tax=Endocarpon pusillum (strain Z07020 / HMAS-L-300199) TaxID=1263415 RepID=U1GX17_ENDPU|nr:uncharacterized protein EPUS_07959 [Endocarpon pusillum Z07020]ERF77053.1 hypothetical protein EPUS_07959 [Endocarpon pusillum Z07020]